MCDTIEVKGGAISEDELQNGVNFHKKCEADFPISKDDCKMFIKKETKLESNPERTPIKIKSEIKEDPVSDAGMGSGAHYFSPEFIMCNNYTATNETDAKIDIKEENEWLETAYESETPAAPDVQVENSDKLQDTPSEEEEDSSLLESPRGKTKCGLRGSWSGESMKEALDQVVAGKIGLREAAKRYGVPKSSLYDRIKLIRNGVHVNILPKLGRFEPTFMGIEEKLVQYLQELNDCLMPLTRKEFLKLAYDLAEKLKIDHRFNKVKKTAGKHFYKNFMERHPELSLCVQESTSRMRHEGYSKQQIEHFYKKLEDLMRCHSFPPSHIYSMSDTVISCTDTNQKVLKTEEKQKMRELTSAKREKIVTVTFAMNPMGHFIPPYFIFPHKRMNRKLMNGAPEKSVGFAQENGYMSGEIFLLWLKHFVKHVQPGENNPVLLILDAFKCQKELQVILFAQEHNIHMLSLPANTCHKLQPLNCTFMKPFTKCVSEWMKENISLGIAEKDVARIVSAAYSKVCHPDIAKNGFSCTGIYPFNSHLYLQLDFLSCRENQLPVACLGSGNTTVGVKQLDRIRNQNSPKNSHNMEQMGITNHVSDGPNKSSPHPATSERRLSLRKKSQKTEDLTSRTYKRQCDQVRNRNSQRDMHNVEVTNYVSDGLNKSSPHPATSERRLSLRKKSQKTEDLTSRTYKRQCDQVRNRNSQTDMHNMEVINHVSDGPNKSSPLPATSERRLSLRKKSQKTGGLTSRPNKQHCDQIKNQNSPRDTHNMEQMEITDHVSDSHNTFSSLPATSERIPSSKKKSQKTGGLNSRPNKQHCDQIENQNSPRDTHNMEQMEITNHFSVSIHNLSLLHAASRKKSPKTESLSSIPYKRSKGSFIFKSIYSSSW